MSQHAERLIYLDNAATSWPKPECVIEAVVGCLRTVGASPGRAGHRLALEAERVRFDARRAVATLLGLRDPMRVIFTVNATTALNLVLQGLLSSGAHVVATGLEHNAVMRPLRELERRGVSLSILPGRADGSLDPGELPHAIRSTTRLIVATHASNVCGSIMPIRELGEIAHQHGIPFLVDAAQTAGCLPIDMHADHIDLLAFSGHKSLLGPSGVGGLALREDFDINGLPPLVRGGTGSRSEHEEHPDMLPDKYEPGTCNIVGLAGVGASARWILERGVETIRAHEQRLTARLLNGLKAIAGVRVAGPGDASRQVAIVSFRVEGWGVSELAGVLDRDFDILSRPGLHCAPLAHRTLGTQPEGTVRLAPGAFSTAGDIDRAVEAVALLAKEA